MSEREPTDFAAILDAWDEAGGQLADLAGPHWTVVRLPTGHASRCVILEDPETPETEEGE